MILYEQIQSLYDNKLYTNVAALVSILRLSSSKSLRTGVIKLHH